MITIALDESGSFEKDNEKDYEKDKEKDNKISFIGGIIYKGEDIEEEEKRLKEYLETISKEIAIKFKLEKKDNIFQYLHSTTNNKIDKSINEDILIKIKEYLKKSNKYSFVAFIRDREEEFKNNILLSSENNLINDKYASNLYERMSIESIINIIYYIPALKNENKINLNVATRVRHYQKESEEYKEYMKLGYSNKEDKNNEVRFYLNDVRTYKAALSTKILSKDSYDNKEYKLNVESINYNDGSSCKFLYLADLSCELIKRCLNNKDIKLEELNKESLKDTGCEFNIFYDNEVNLLWNKMVDKYNEKKLVDVLEIKYSMLNLKNPISEYYLKKWVSSLDLKKIFEENRIGEYIENIKVNFKKEIAQYEKGIWLIKELEKLIKELDVKEKEKFIFELEYQLLSGYNHRGDIINALKTHKLCEEYKGKGISLMEYFSYENRVATLYSNIFQYDKIIETLDEVVAIYDTMDSVIEMVQEECGLNNVKSNYISEKGKTFSNIGQAYAFKGEFSQAEENFKKALNIFRDNNDDSNFNVTRSYLLHLYISKNDKESYKKLSEEKFKTMDLVGQFQQIKESNDRFYLFVFIKGLYVFYKDDFPEEILDEVIESFRLRDKFNLEEHPASLIVKYVVLLMNCRDNYRKRISNFIKNNLNCVKNQEFTLEVINEYTLKELGKVIEKIGDNSKGLKRVYNKYKDIVNDYIDIESYSEFCEKLDSMITYMYK